jgi:hypothetical protein
MQVFCVTRAARRSIIVPSKTQYHRADQDDNELRICSADSSSSHKDIKWFFPFVNPLARVRHAFRFINDGVALRTSRRGDGQLSGTDARPACREIDGTATEVLQLHWPSVQHDLYLCINFSVIEDSVLDVRSAQPKPSGLKFRTSGSGSDVTCNCHNDSSRSYFSIFANSLPSFVFRSLHSFTPRIY